MSATTLELPAGPAATARWAAVAFVASYSSPGTRQAYSTQLRLWFDWSAQHRLDPLTDIRRPHVELYARDLETRGLAPATVALKLGVCPDFRCSPAIRMTSTIFTSSVSRSTPSSDRVRDGRAQNGKSAITIRQLLSHQAGLAVLDRQLTLADVADPDRLASILAVQAPAWEPGTRHGYHAITLGFYESELLRRVDPHGRTLGRFFADEVAGPLDAEFYIGVPEHVRDERIATIHAFKPVEMLLHLDKMPTRLLISMLNPRGTMSRAMRSISFLMEPGAFNRREVRAAELPSVNGTGQIRAIARIYSAFATGGTELGIGPATLRLLEEPGTDPVRGLRDAVVQMDTRFSLGYLKPFPGFEFGSSDRAYGTPGGGGSLGFVDPDARVGYAYGMNRLGFHNPIDPRELAVRAAFYACIGARPQTAK